MCFCVWVCACHCMYKGSQRLFVGVSALLPSWWAWDWTQTFSCRWGLLCEGFNSKGHTHDPKYCAQRGMGGMSSDLGPSCFIWDFCLVFFQITIENSLTEEFMVEHQTQFSNVIFLVLLSCPPSNRLQIESIHAAHWTVRTEQFLVVVVPSHCRGNA